LINPNSIGLLLAIAAPIFFWRLVRRWDAIGLGVMAAGIVSLLLSGSRNGFLAVTAAGALLLARVRFQTLIVLIFCAIVTVTALEVSQAVNQIESTIHNSFALSRLFGIDEVGTGSGRFTFWADNAQVIEDNIWTGNGFGTEDVGSADLNQYGPQNFGLFHNSYLGILYQLGLPGLLLLFGPLVFLFMRTAWLSRYEPGFSNTAILLAVLFANFLSAFFETWIYSVGNAFSFPFWICVMLLVRRLIQPSK
jgi:O-antigen ligase